MKKTLILFAIFVSLLFLFTSEVTLETGSNEEIGKYRVHCIVINGYLKTSGENFTDYITFNTDSLYKVGDTIYIGK